MYVGLGDSCASVTPVQTPECADWHSHRAGDLASYHVQGARARLPYVLAHRVVVSVTVTNEEHRCREGRRGAGWVVLRVRGPGAGQRASY